MQTPTDQDYAKFHNTIPNQPNQQPPQPPQQDFPPQYPPQYQQQQQQPYIPYPQQQGFQQQQFPQQQQPYPQQFPQQQVYPPAQVPYQQGQQAQIIIVQPGQQQQVQDQGPQVWKNPLCGCMKDCSLCLVSFCCCCALLYNHANAINKATKGINSFCQACFLDCMGCSCFNRQALRRAYNIDGSLFEDCCLTCFCTFCALMQDINEAEERG